jgi:hypothetical protein
MLGAQGLGLDHQLGVPALGKPGGQPHIQPSQPNLRQPAPLGGEVLTVRELGVRCAPPQRQRLIHVGLSLNRFAAFGRLAGLANKINEHIRVEIGSACVESVARRRGLDDGIARATRVKRRAQPGHVHLHALGRSGRRRASHSASAMASTDTTSPRRSASTARSFRSFGPPGDHTRSARLTCSGPSTRTCTCTS